MKSAKIKATTTASGVSDMKFRMRHNPGERGVGRIKNDGSQDGRPRGEAKDEYAQLRRFQDRQR